MIFHGFVSCDLCGTHMGQLWNQPAAAPDLLPAPDFRVCDDCYLNSCECSDPECIVMGCSLTASSSVAQNAVLADSFQVTT